MNRQLFFEHFDYQLKLKKSMKILVIKIYFQIFSVSIDYLKFSLFDQQILGHSEKKYIVE